jgi:Phosphatidylglycerophosphate synthase
MKLKFLPNLITGIRLLGSLLFLFVRPFSVIFFVIYFICGLSDVLDGMIARRMRTCSQFGAALDSVSDALFIGIILFVIIPYVHCSHWMLLWIGVIALVRCISLAVGFLKYHKLAFLHTYANKATGLLLFFAPFLINQFGMTAAFWLVCCPASISAIEELMINLASKKLDRDISSIFAGKY